MKEQVMKSFKQFLDESKYQAHVVNVIEDKEFLISHESEIMTLINNAYAPIGGYKGRPLSKKTPFDMVDLAKIVFDANHSIIALAMYSKHLGGNKRFCSAGIRGNQESREAVVEHQNAQQAINVCPINVLGTKESMMIADGELVNYAMERASEEIS